LFHNLNATEPDKKVQSFAASAGWCECFKGHHWFHNLKLKGKVAAAECVAVDKLRAFVQAAAERHGYLPPAKYCQYKIRLFWTQMLSRMFVSMQKMAPGFKPSKDHCTLLLRGEYRIEPLMAYHSENPCALTHFSKGVVPAV
jgi:hypothetical protein